MKAGGGDDAALAGDVMMELVERAIPVIQHPPEARLAADPVRTADVPAIPTTTSVASTQEDVCAHEDRDTTAASSSAVAQVYRTLERLRTQQAQLTSGTLLQQYQRQLTFDVENSRPTTKVLSVQG